MGILTDIAVADDGDAVQICDRVGGPAGAWPTVQWKFITTLELSELWALVGGCGGNADACMDHMESLLLHQRSDAGPWTYRLPDGLVDALSGLDAEGAGDLAVRWAATDAFYWIEGEWWRKRAESARNLARRLRGIPLFERWARKRARRARFRIEEELARHRTQTAGYLQEYLKEVSQLARMARHEGKQLLLWVCL